MATSLRHLHYDSMMCPAPSFPNTFKDFFQTLNEDDDVIATMLEDKLIPRSDTTSSESSRDQEKQRQYRRGMSCRHYKRRSSEHHTRKKQNSLPSQSSEIIPPQISPSVNRRRSSSIAATRPPPDLHRFLQAEQNRPWGRLNSSSPPSRSHLSPNHNSAISPAPTSPVFGSRLHLSPGTSPSAREPTSPSPRRGYTPNFNEYQRSRTRTSSMPAVPRHRVSII